MPKRKPTPNKTFEGLIKIEIEAITAQLKSEADQEERIGLRAEIVHLRRLLARFRNQAPRPPSPPQAGLPVPAIPPNGPLPKQGGAAAPLDFEA